MVWGGRREEGSGWGTHVYLWQIHFNVWQNQYNIVKFKNKIKKKFHYDSQHTHTHTHTQRATIDEKDKKASRKDLQLKI